MAKAYSPYFYVQPSFETKAYPAWVVKEDLDYARKKLRGPLHEIEGFLSYSHLDKDIAGRVKEYFKELGINCFLAHEDIKVTDQWEREIIKNLSSCDIFIPIITDNFRHSDWTDQESGMAIGRDIMIFPISPIDSNSHSVDPYGFIGKYQSLKIKFKSTGLLKEEQIRQNLLKDVISALKKERNLGPLARKSFIQAFALTGSYSEAKIRSSLLTEFEPFSKQEVETIFLAFLFNNQLYKSYSVPKVMSELSLKWPSKLDRAIYSMYSAYLAT